MRTVYKVNRALKSLDHRETLRQAKAYVPESVTRSNDAIKNDGMLNVSNRKLYVDLTKRYLSIVTW